MCMMSCTYINTVNWLRSEKGVLQRQKGTTLVLIQLQKVFAASVHHVILVVSVGFIKAVIDAFFSIEPSPYRFM